MKWLVLKQFDGGRYAVFGPILAEDARQACDDLARGNALPAHSSSDAIYVAQGKGRYFAVPLDAWQDGAFVFTKTRGTETLFSGS